MANLRDIKKRINSVKSTKQITHTMEMVSSAKIRRATERVHASSPYYKAMQRMLANLTDGVTDSEQALLQTHEEVKRVTLIVIVSDRGLAGAFNTSVLHEANKLRKHYMELGADVEVIVAGKKGIPYFNYREVKPSLVFTDLSADPTIDESREISAYVRDAYMKQDTDKVIMLYNHARNAADQDLKTEQILPVDTSSLDTEEEKSNFAPDIEFEPSSEAVLESLLPDYVDTIIYHALVDSAAAEQGARRRAMKSATDNASDIITTLQRQYNSARQAAITTEINEIVGGAAALED